MYKSAVEPPAPCSCFLTGVIITNRAAPCPNLQHAVHTGASGEVGSAAAAAAAAADSGAITHVHCLELAADGPHCARPLDACDAALLGQDPAGGVRGVACVWHLNCLRSVVAAAPGGGAALRLRVFAVRDADIRPHVPQARLP
jgi:hypothetical protein